MFAHHPHVPEHGDRLLRLFRDRVVIRQSFERLLGVAQEFFDFLVGEAGQVEVEALLFKRLQFDVQHLFVPSGVEREPIVREHQSTALGGSQMVEYDNGRLCHPQLPRRCQSRVTGDDHAVPAHQDRIRPAELDDAGRDLGDLRVGMGPCVAGVRDQFVDRPSLDREIAQDEFRFRGTCCARCVPRDLHELAYCLARCAPKAEATACWCDAGV